jgi:hypothetical protein
MFREAISLSRRSVGLVISILVDKLHNIVDYEVPKIVIPYQNKKYSEKEKEPVN